jgi:hypothetical protein
MEVQLLLATHKEQSRADHDRSDTGPYRDVDRFLVLDRKLERAELGVVGRLGVGDATVHQPNNAGGDQQDCHDLKCAHLTSLYRTPVVI